MKNRFNIYIIFLLLSESVFFISKNYAQEFRSGEITTVISPPISDCHVFATVVIYTEDGIPVRPWLHIYWGDGKTDSLPFLLSNQLQCANYRIFNFEHNYSGYGDYIIEINEPNYMGNIVNITNSSNESFKLIKDVKIRPDIGLNNSVKFTYDQVCEWICCNWILDIAAYDPDPSDSLSFELTPCLVSNYSFTNATLDSVHGYFQMYPQTIGNYAAAITVKEWRRLFNDMTLIGSTTRQLLLNVNSLISVNESELNSKVIIYPTLSQKEIFIKYSDIRMMKVNVCNYLGNTLNTEFNIDSNNKIDISILKPGFYFLFLETDNGLFIRKFVKI